MSYLTSNLNLKNSNIDVSVQNYTEVTIARKAVLNNLPPQSTPSSAPMNKKFAGKIVENTNSLVLPKTEPPTPLEAKTSVPPPRGVNTIIDLQPGSGYINGSSTNVATKAQRIFTPSLPLQYVDSTGVGLTLDIEVVAGQVISATICNPGRNYNVGDKITILGGGFNSEVVVSTLLESPLAKTHEAGFIQLDQGGSQFPSGAWGEFMRVLSVSKGSNSLIITTKTQHGLNPNDRVDINDLTGLSGHNFTVIGVRNENTFEVNYPSGSGLPTATVNTTIRARRAKAPPSQAGMNMLPKNFTSITKNLPISLLSLQTNMPGRSVNQSSNPTKTIFGSDKLGIDFSQTPAAAQNSAASLITPPPKPVPVNFASIYPDFNTQPSNGLNTPVYLPQIFGQVGNSFGISRGAATSEASTFLPYNLNSLYSTQ